MSDHTASSPDIWASFLKEGEKILWQGRPSGAFHMRRGDGWNIFGGIITMLITGFMASIYYKKIAKRQTDSRHNSPGETRKKTPYSTRYIYKGFELIPDGAVAYQTMLGVIGAKLANPDAAKAGKGGEAWQDFLFEGETLLWEGAPTTGLRPTKFGIIFSVLGVLVMVIAGPTAVRAFTSEYGGAEAMIFGVVAAGVFVLAFAIVAGIWLLDMRLRKATRYALTNKRAFVAKAVGGRNMLTYAIKPHYRPLLLEGRTDEVTFGEEDWFDHKTGAKTQRAISFKYLKDGRDVYAIITRVSVDIDAAAEAQK